MSLPWTKKKDTNLFYDEYTQSSTINRIFNRLLDNDRYIWNKFLRSHAKAVSIPFATSGDIQSLATSAKAIWTDNIMSISATDSDIVSEVDNRFITATKNKEVLAGLTTGTSYIDITHLDPYEKWPSEDVIQQAAEGIIGNFSPRENLVIIVMFKYREYEIVLNNYNYGWLGYINIGTEYEAKLCRYKYKMENVGGNIEWVYQGRITNTGDKLTE